MSTVLCTLSPSEFFRKFPPSSSNDKNSLHSVEASTFSPSNQASPSLDSVYCNARKTCVLEKNTAQCKPFFSHPQVHNENQTRSSRAFKLPVFLGDSKTMHYKQNVTTASRTELITFNSFLAFQLKKCNECYLLVGPTVRFLNKLCTKLIWFMMASTANNSPTVHAIQDRAHIMERFESSKFNSLVLNIIDKRAVLQTFKRIPSPHSVFSIIQWADSILSDICYKSCGIKEHNMNNVSSAVRITDEDLIKAIYDVTFTDRYDWWKSFLLADDERANDLRMEICAISNTMTKQRMAAIDKDLQQYQFSGTESYCRMCLYEEISCRNKDIVNVGKFPYYFDGTPLFGNNLIKPITKESKIKIAMKRSLSWLFRSAQKIINKKGFINDL